MAQYKSLAYLYFVAIIASLGGAVQGLLVSILNAAILQVELSLNWQESQDYFRLGVASALIPLGAIFGGFMGGCLADIIGRRKTLMLADCIVITGFALTYSGNFSIFCIGRFIQGISYGINGATTLVYIREIAPPEISGNLVGVYKISFSVGLTTAYGTAFALPLTPTLDNQFWKLIFALPAIFGLFRLLCFLTILTYDTPKYYIMKEQFDKAKNVLIKIYAPEYINEIYERERKVQTSIAFSDIFSYKYRSQFYLCLFIFFTITYMGMNSLNYYSTYIFLGTNKENGQSDDFVLEVRILNLCIGLIRIVGATLGSYLVDKWGRRPLILFGNNFIIIVLLCFSMFGFLYLGLEQRIFVLLFAFGIANSYNMVMSVYISEVLPAKGIGIIIVSDNFNQVLMNLLFPVLVNTPARINWSFMVFALVGLISLPILLMFYRETKGKTLYEIYQIFHPELEEAERLLKNNKIKSEDNDDDNVNNTTETRIKNFIVRQFEMSNKLTD